MAVIVRLTYNISEFWRRALLRGIQVGMLAVTATTVVLSATATANDADPHAAVFADTQFPSAMQCASCHPKVFWEWAVSNHAYASISPMFHKFEQTINDFASGTVGTFCVRCHQQIGTQLGEPREAPLWERSAISAEFGKVNGERHVDAGDIHQPITGAGTGSDYPTAVANADELGIATAPGADGTPIHGPVIKFEQISKSEFCVSCHQVAVHPGIKLEVVWEQYRGAPAAKEGIACQDCHMGKVPGEPLGYETWPIAIGQVS